MSSDEEYEPTSIVVDKPKQEEKPAEVRITNTEGAEEKVSKPSIAGAEPPRDVSLPVTALQALAEKRKSLEGAEGGDGGLRFRSAISGRIRDVCVNPSGSVLCAVSEDGYFCMWDFHTALETRRLQPTRTLTPFVNRIAGLQSIVSVHSSIDSSYFVACQDGDAPVLVSKSGKQLGYCAKGERGIMDVVQCKGHRNPVTSSAPDVTDAKQFYTASQDGTARLWSESQFELKSLYAVKHGSGQLTDTHIVDCVLGLSPKLGNSLFCTSGADGFVQIWDHRVKYRPGGSAVSWDVHAELLLKSANEGPSGKVNPLGRSARRQELDPFAEQKHTGMLVEMEESGVPMLAVGVKDQVKILDIRKPFVKTAMLACEGVKSLPQTLETVPLIGSSSQPAGCGSSFLTGTSRAGYNHIVGGHVLRFQKSAAEMQCVSVWRAGRSEEDVLCVCDDKFGNTYCGLNSGAVVVQMARDTSIPIRQWLDSRPQIERAPKRERSQDDEEGDALEGEPLF